MFFKTFAPSLVTLTSVSLLVAGCNPGYYSTDFSGGCAPCKAGTYDSHSGAGIAATSCTNCPAGTSSSAVAAHASSACHTCSPGSFSPAGASSCCTCCAGYYSGSGASSCTQCPNSLQRYSPPGSDNAVDCTTGGPSQPVGPGLCKVGTDNRCPATIPNGPEGSQIKKRRDVVKCTRGYESCPLLTGSSGFECVDTKSDPEMCGGCVGPDGEGAGRDCTTISGISVARCVRSRCVIDTCRRGFTLNVNGSTCVPVSRLSIQQPGQKHKS